MKAVLKTFAGFAASMVILSSCSKNVIEPQAEALSSEVSSEANAADAEPETSPASWTSVVANVGTNVGGFWQGVPQKYSRTTKRYPLIVFLHGIGEVGTNLTRMNCCGLPNHMYNKTFPAQFTINGVNYSFLVIAPQFKSNPKPADVQAVVNYAKNRWRVDASRVYVVGLSLGGGAVWNWAASYGESAAAVVPVCGGQAPSTTLAQKVASKNLPIWGLYSSADQYIPESWGYDWFRWIDQYNSAYASKTKLTVWNDVDHNHTWGRAFNPTTKVDGYNIYQWLLLNKRGTTSTAPAPAPAPSPTPTTGNIAPVAKHQGDGSYPKSWNWFPVLNGNFSTDSDGWITKYVWTKISGPSCTITPILTGRSKVTGATAAGTYVFRLTVTDNKGATNYKDLRITLTNN